MRSGLLLNYFLILVSSVVFFGFSGKAASEQKEPGCTNSKCHTVLSGFKFPHAVLTPCDSCHTLTDSKKHKFKLVAEGKALCSSCHEDVEKEKAFKHSPVSEGSCTACHDPHGANNRKLVREADISKVCFQCHEDKISGKPYKHGPLQSGDCISCHKSHGSDKPRLLDLTGSYLCSVCHGDKTDFSKAKSVHAPTKMNCTVCHDPHASVYPKYVKSTFTRICLNCHVKATKVKDQWTAQVGKSSGFRCSDCHSPHFSMLKNLLTRDLSGPCPVLK